MARFRRSFVLPVQGETGQVIFIWKLQRTEGG
jgi:hypothetical protein